MKIILRLDFFGRNDRFKVSLRQTCNFRRINKKILNRDILNKKMKGFQRVNI